MKYSVEPYRLGFAVEFILENEQKEDKCSNNFRCEYLACFKDGEVVGVIGYQDSKNSRRIRMVIAKEEHRNKTVYGKLINAAADADKELTVFAPPNITKHFIDNDFVTVKVNRFLISFMKKKKEDDSNEQLQEPGVLYSSDTDR